MTSKNTMAINIVIPNRDPGSRLSYKQGRSFLLFHRSSQRFHRSSQHLHRSSQHLHRSSQRKLGTSILLFFVLLATSLHAGINTDNSDSKLTFRASNSAAKLVLGSSIGDGTNSFYAGTIDIPDPYLHRRVESTNATDVLYLKKATVITGTSRAYVSGQYANESTGADGLDQYSLTSSGDGLSFIRFEPGQEVRNLNIAGGVGEAWIQGAPVFKTPIVLNDAAPANSPYIIHWGLTSKLNQSIQLPTMTISGTNRFILDNDLSLGDGVVFLPSTRNYPYHVPELRITFSNSKLRLGGKDVTWSSTLLLEEATDVEMNANVNLASTWTFSGDSLLQGNGNVLDLRSSGTIAFDSSALVNNSNTMTLNIRDVKIILRNGALFTHERTVIDLSNVEIELEHTVNFTSGNIHVSGPTMIYAKNYTFSVSNAATLTVDGTVLYFDTGGFAANEDGVYPKANSEDNYNSHDNLSLQHNGYIAQMGNANSTWSISSGDVDSSSASGGTGTENDPWVIVNTENKWISNDTQILFLTDGDSYYRFDGDNYFLHCARESDCLSLQASVKVSFVNTVFKDFDPTAITLQGSGSSKARIYFGQGCVLEFAQDVELGASTDDVYTLSFRLDTTGTKGTGVPGDENIIKVNGYGHRVSLPYASGQTTPGQMVLDDQDDGGGIRVEFENIILDKLGGWPTRFESEHPVAQLYSLQHTNTVLYRNARLNLSNNYSYTQAGMMVDGVVNIETRQNTATDHPDGGDIRTNNIFIFQPARKSTLTFSHNAQLVVGQNVTFSLDAMVTRTTMAGMLVNGGTPFSGGSTGNVEYDAPWKAIVFPDDTPVMQFNGSTFHVTGTGLFFQRGAVNIEDNVTWVVRDDGADNAQKKISLDTTSGSEVTLNILAGATIDIQGAVHHEEV